MRKIIVGFAVLFVLAAILDAFNGASSSSNSTDAPAINVTTTVNASTDKFSTYYDDLTSSQKKIYDAEKVAVEAGEYQFSVNVSDVSSDDIIGAVYAFWADHPGIFWIDPDSIDGYINENSIDIILSNYKYFDYADISKAQTELNGVISEWVAKIKESAATKYDQALLAHDMLTAYATYDNDALEEMEETSYPPADELIRTSYGALVNKECVCVGYAVAYKLILDQLDIPCTVILGEGITSEGSGGHAWNKIQLDGEGYYVDATWDNIDDENFDSYYPDREYFNSDISLFTNNHNEYGKADIGTINNVSCNGEKYQFFKYENLSLDDYSEFALQEIINNHLDNSSIQVKFSTDEEAAIAQAAIESGSIDLHCLRGDSFVFDSGILWILRAGY